LPSRQQTLRAKERDGRTIYLMYNIAKKLYRCPYCRICIPIGSAHVTLSRIQAPPRHDHDHIHAECVQRRLLPKLTEIEIIGAQKVSVKDINARRRKYRYKRRKNRAQEE
jgi:hypothetical protein